MKNSYKISYLVLFCCIIIFALIQSGCSGSSQRTSSIIYNQMKDIDGNIYKTVKIGNQEWMAEDLKVSHYRNGDKIPHYEWIPNPNDLDYIEQWGKLESGALCIYLKPDRDCYIDEGRMGVTLYNWYAVNDARGLAPSGWHIPSEEEWLTLINYLGGMNIAGKSLKHYEGWDTKYAENGTNISGFSALPTGSRNENGYAMGFCQYAWFWTSKIGEKSTATYFSIGYQVNNMHSIIKGKAYWKEGLAIRCIKD